MYYYFCLQVETETADDKVRDMCLQKTAHSDGEGIESHGTPAGFPSASVRICPCMISLFMLLQCFDTVDFMTGRSSGLQNILLWHFPEVLLWRHLGDLARPGVTSGKIGQLNKNKVDVCSK